MQNIAFKIRELRKSRNFTQERLADLLGMSVKTYQRLERGAILPTLEQGVELSGIYGVSLEEFFPQIKSAMQTPLDASALQAEIDRLQSLLQTARAERQIMLQVIQRLSEELGKRPGR